jgi:mRNA interferase MazF
MVRYQWGVFWAVLNPTIGSEQSGIRPVLVVSAEAVNQALTVVAVVPLTSMKPGRRIYSTEVFLPEMETGLPKDSLALAHQVRTITKKRLTVRCGEITDTGLRDKIRNALKQYLDLHPG